MSGREDEAPSGAELRSPVEWVTFAVAALVIAAVLGLIATEIPESRRPADPVAQVAVTEAQGDRFAVAVVVENRGEATASNVQVRATLTIDGDDREGDQVIDFLSGGEREELVFVFEDDPSDAELEVRVTGFLVP